MLPPFDDFGNLPVGIHKCSIEELVSRFGTGSEERTTLIDEFLQFVDVARIVGVRRLLVNGSFVTGVLAPNDVDVVFLGGPDYPRGHRELDASTSIWPFLHVLAAYDDNDFEAWGTGYFSSDRQEVKKGVVEVEL